MSATVAPTVWSTTSLVYGQSYSITVKSDPTTKTATLWVNPSTEASTSVSNTGTLAAAAISTIALRQGGAQTLASTFTVGNTDCVWSVDKLGVGTTWSDACPGGVTPTRSTTWGSMKSLYR